MAQKRRQGQRQRQQARQPAAQGGPERGARYAAPPQDAAAHPSGRRARQRLAQEQAERRRRLMISLGGASGLVVVAIVVFAILSGRSGSQNNGLTDLSKFNPNSHGLRAGSVAPDFDLATVQGTHYRLSALRGHPVLVELFAVWCPHCQRETVVLNEIEKVYASSGLRGVGLLASPYGRNYDLSGGSDTRLADSGDIAWFRSTFHVTQPLLIDPTFTVVNRYGLVSGGYPTIYLLDRHGIVRYAVSGEQSYQQLASAVDAASKH